MQIIKKTLNCMQIIKKNIELHANYLKRLNCMQII